MIDWFLSSLLLVCGFFLLAGSLQGLLLALAPTRTSWYPVCWSLFNTLLALSVPTAALLKRTGFSSGDTASSIVVGGIFTLMSLGPGVLALVFILGRRWPHRAPIWDARRGLIPLEPLTMGALLLMILMSVCQYQPVRGLGAVSLIWAYFYLLRQHQMSVPPFQIGIQLRNWQQPAALLGILMSLVMIGYGSSCLVDLSPRVSFGAGLESLIPLLVIPLSAFLFTLLNLLWYTKNGQDYLAGAYLIGSLIPQITILPAVVVTWGEWSLDWAGLFTLIIAAGLTLALASRARGPSGVPPSLLLAMAAFYPLYIFVWWLVW